MGQPLMAGLEVIRVQALAPATTLLWLKAPEGFPKPFPGQFAKLRALGPPQIPLKGGRALLDKPFSFHGADGDSLAFLIREVGTETAILATLSPGAKVRLTGPLGAVRPELSGKGPLLLVAGGAGLGPMGMFRPQGFGPISLLYGERDASFQVGQGFLRGLADRVLPFTDDGSGHGEKGLVTQGLERELKADGPKPLVFCCGPPGLLREAARLCRERDVRLYVSAEAFMACGLGICLSCSIPAKGGGRVRVCVDGPVFPGDTAFP